MSETKRTWVISGDGCRKIILMLCLAGLHPWDIIWPCRMVHSACAQTTSFHETLQSKLDRYYNKHMPVITDIQFNQPAYVAGDTAWFSAWITTEREGLPLGGRQVLHVDLAAPSGRIVQRLKVLANNGLAYSQLVVPPELPEGVYTVVIWTEGMVDNDPSVFSYRELIVTSERGVSRGFMPLSAYPEGGHLVPRITNKLTLTGRPGAVIEMQSDGVSTGTVRLDQYGYGHAYVYPRAASSFIFSDGQSSYSLSTSTVNLAMTLQFYDSLPTCKFVIRHAGRRQDAARLAIVSRGKVVYAAVVSLADTASYVTVPRRVLPPGLLLATLFDSSNQVLAGRLFVDHWTECGMEIVRDSNVPESRDRISIVLAGREQHGLPATVRIYAEELFDSAATRDTSPLPVSCLSWSGLGFQIDSRWTIQQWNTFLSTQQWRRFNWNDVWHERGERAVSPGTYLKFKGRVMLTQNPAEFDSVRVTFFLRKEARIYEEYVSSSGELDLLLFFDFDDEEEVIYTIDRKGSIIKDAILQIEEERQAVYALPAGTQAPGKIKYPAFAALCETIRAAYKDYPTSEHLDDFDANAMVEDELFEADITVRLDDYVLFPTMEETLREIVPRLQHRWRGKRHTVQVALMEPDIVATEDPLYFIDGVLTDDTDYFMNLNPADVATIKVVAAQRKLRTLGILGKNGIVLVTTKIADNHLRVPRTRRSFTATGFTRYVPFTNTPALADRTPWFRSTVYFNPTLALDASGRTQFQFTVPDNSGRFRIEVVVLGTDGSRCTSYDTFRVSTPLAGRQR